MLSTHNVGVTASVVPQLIDSRFVISTPVAKSTPEALVPAILRFLYNYPMAFSAVAAGLGAAGAISEFNRPIRKSILRGKEGSSFEVGHFSEESLVQPFLSKSTGWPGRSQSRTRIIAAAKKKKAGKAKPQKAPGDVEKKADVRPLKALFTPGEPKDGTISLRVDLPGEDTKRFYDKLLIQLAKTCPPIPGAPLKKGGKASRVEPFEVIYMIGEQRVKGFIVQEMVSSSLKTFVEERNLNASKEATTAQTSAELVEAFEPGQPFGFDAIVQLLETTDIVGDAADLETSEIISA